MWTMLSVFAWKKRDSIPKDKLPLQPPHDISSGLVSENFGKITSYSKPHPRAHIWNKVLIMIMMMTSRMMTMSTVMMRILSYTWVVYSFPNVLTYFPNCCYNKCPQNWWLNLAVLEVRSLKSHWAENQGFF